MVSQQSATDQEKHGIEKLVAHRSWRRHTAHLGRPWGNISTGGGRGGFFPGALRGSMPAAWFSIVCLWNAEKKCISIVNTTRFGSFLKAPLVEKKHAYLLKAVLKRLFLILSVDLVRDWENRWHTKNPLYHFYFFKPWTSKDLLISQICVFNIGLIGS